MSDIKIICQNKRARHEYFVEDSLECGLMLRGPEVKSLRDGKANLTDSYASVERSEVWLNNFHINPYSPAQLFNLHPTRKRKLLLNLREINKLIGRAQEKGYTLVPLKVYFKNHYVDEFSKWLYYGKGVERKVIPLSKSIYKSLYYSVERRL